MGIKNGEKSCPKSVKNVSLLKKFRFNQIGIKQKQLAEKENFVIKQ